MSTSRAKDLMEKGFARHLRMEIDRFVENEWDHMVDAFQDDWKIRLTRKGKQELVDAIEVKVFVNGEVLIDRRLDQSFIC